MKKILIVIGAVAAIALAAPTVFAVGDNVATAPSNMSIGKGSHKGPQTRQEAIVHMKERLTKLEAMSDSEWQEKRDKMKQNRKGKGKLTPEERKKLKDKFKEQQK